MTVQRRAGVVAVAIMALTASGCGGDDSDIASPSDTQTAADDGSPATGDDAPSDDDAGSTPTGDAPSDDEPSDDTEGSTTGDDPQTGGDASSGSPAGVRDCDDVPQSALDLVAPGLEPDEITTTMPFTEIACIWDSDTVFLQLSAFDGQQFWPEPLFEDEEAEMIPVDLCDRAFVVEIFGLDLNVLDGDTVWSVGASQAGVPQDQRMGREEGIDRLVEFARVVIGC